MKQVILGLILLSGWAGFAQAQTFDLINDRLYEPLIASEMSHNARSLGLGGVSVAIVHDGSALWYNPAALARVPRLEVLGGASHTDLNSTSLPLGVRPVAPPPSVSPRAKSMAQARGGSLYASFPIRTYRGALTIGLGVAVTNDLNRILAGRLDFAPGDFVDTLDDSPGNVIAEQIEEFVFHERQTGQVHAVQLGFGIAVSPRMSFGATGVYYNGTLQFNNYTRFSGTRFEEPNPGIPVTWEFNTLTSEKMQGGGAHLGWLWFPRNNIGLGLTAKTPTILEVDIEQYFTEERDSSGAIEYFEPTTTRKITLPGSVTFGGSWRLGPLLLAGDIAVTDWSQTEYSKTDYALVTNNAMSQTYRLAGSAGAGVELTIPPIGAALRAGVRLDELPYDTQYVVQDRITWSGGLGLLLQRTWAIDLGVAHSTYRGGNPLYGFDEGYGKWTILLTAAFRPAGKLW